MVKYFLILFLGFWSVTTLAKSLIRAPSEVEVAVDQPITLGVLTNVGEFPGLVKKSVDKLVMGQAPQTGQKIIFTNSALALAFRKVLTEEENKNYQLVLPSQISVKVQDNSYNSENIKNAIIQIFQKKCESCRVVIKNLNLPLISPNDKVLKWTIESDINLPKATFNVPIVIENQESKNKQYWITGQIAIFKKVPVAAKIINRGDKLTMENIRLEERDITFSLDSAPIYTDLIGKQTNQFLKAGDVLWHSVILREKAVSRGEIVKLILGTDQFEITTTGKVNQDAYIGDQVEIIPLGGNRVIMGSVTSKSEVRIE
jgi:flagella basal body P-ring formation protein FlgA